MVFKKSFTALYMIIIYRCMKNNPMSIKKILIPSKAARLTKDFWVLCITQKPFVNIFAFLKVSKIFYRLLVIFHASIISLAIFQDIHETNRFVGLHSGSLKLAESCIFMETTRPWQRMHPRNNGPARSKTFVVSGLR